VLEHGDVLSASFIAADGTVASPSV
jgi:hypothetical protein